MRSLFSIYSSEFSVFAQAFLLRHQLNVSQHTVFILLRIVHCLRLTIAGWRTHRFALSIFIQQNSTTKRNKKDSPKQNKCMTFPCAFVSSLIYVISIYVINHRISCRGHVYLPLICVFFFAFQSFVFFPFLF